MQVGNGNGIWHIQAPGCVFLINLPGGSIMGFNVATTAKGQEVVYKVSADNGLTWSESRTLFELPLGYGKWYEESIAGLLDKYGELHIFLLNFTDEKMKASDEENNILKGELLERRIDIWHVKSEAGRTKWRRPVKIWRGYTGSLNSVIQMECGRIILPFSYMTSRSWKNNRGNGADIFTYKGYYNCTVIYSDDMGESWKAGNSVSVPAHDLGTFGGIEPVVIQRKTGQVWMLIRTQNGRFYESVSEDGICWPDPKPSNIISSDSPAGITRLRDGRMILFWNKCKRFPYAYGGRHVLHAAISDDEGKTWRGCREVARDPRRDEPPPFGGDFGTAYPFPVAVSDGRVLCRAGQGKGRIQMVLVDPQWLLGTKHKACFNGNAEEWSSFGTRGVEFLPDEKEEGSSIMVIKKVEPDWPACAVWNFPEGLAGRLKIKLMLNREFKGALIGIADHFSVPFDMEDKYYNLFNLEIGGNRIFLGKTKLDCEKWYELSLFWDCAKGMCSVHLDGQETGILPLLHETTGACYLRLRSITEGTDPGGFSIASVEAELHGI